MTPLTSFVPPGVDLVERFLQNVRQTVPLAIGQVDMMLRLIDAARDRVGSFLELGCGDGVLSASIFEEHPNARGVLVDLSDQILSGARSRLHSHLDRIEFVAADFTHSGWGRRAAPHAPFDAIVSAFATHCLPDARKRALYEELFSFLKPEGILINFEHVSSATRWTESIWDDYMIEAIFGAEIKGRPHTPRLEVAREYYERISKSGDARAPLEVQCDWLREIGFESVECFLKVQELAMFGGQKPA